MEREITLTAPDGARFQIHVFGEAQPAGPALILFSAVFGVDEDMKQVARRWADRGYLVAVPDYYARVAPGIRDRSEEGRKSAMERWKALDAGAAVADIAVLKAWLLDRPACNGKLATLGICAGGELAFLAALRLGADAMAAYHGTYIERHVAAASELGIPMSLHYGAADPFVPMDKVEAVRVGLSANAKAAIHVYPGAEHGFSFPGRPSYHAEAATTSDRHVQEVFDTLKSEGVGA
jgi:carboxymethylenebutenolidase